MICPRLNLAYPLLLLCCIFGDEGPDAASSQPTHRMARWFSARRHCMLDRLFALFMGIDSVSYWSIVLGRGEGGIEDEIEPIS